MELKQGSHLDPIRRSVNKKLSMSSRCRTTDFTAEELVFIRHFMPSLFEEMMSQALTQEHYTRYGSSIKSFDEVTFSTVMQLNQGATKPKGRPRKEASNE